MDGDLDRFIEAALLAGLGATPRGAEERK
jgi:hypothetical protein